MIASQRQVFILSRLRSRGVVRVTELAQELGVSSMTIRRDIAELSDRGLLRRVHGGAVSASALSSEPLFSVSAQTVVDLKSSIADAAVELVSPGDVVAIGGGSTTYVFAQRLLASHRSDGITILTNSTPVAELVKAGDSKSVDVIVTGGVVTRSHALIGPIAEKTIASLRVNSLFLGAHSVSVPRGFLAPNPLEASTEAALVSIADKTYMLADHTKWKVNSLSLFAQFDDVDTLVTDSGISAEDEAKTRPLVKRLIVAGRDSTGASREAGADRGSVAGREPGAARNSAPSAELPVSLAEGRNGIEQSANSVAEFAAAAF